MAKATWHLRFACLLSNVTTACERGNMMYDQQDPAFLKVKRLGRIMTAFASMSFFVLLLTTLRLFSSGIPLAALMTTQGGLAPSYMLDAVVATNGLCGALLIFEGLLLLLGKEQTARTFLPVSFVLVV